LGFGIVTLIQTAFRPQSAHLIAIHTANLWDACDFRIVLRVKAKTPAEKKASNTRWHLYVLRCVDGTLYCGITTDLKRRLAQHQAGTAARYTRGRGPVVLLRSWRKNNHSTALKAELAFKKLTRAQKERVIGV
jgi:putative endonuclease